jgi:hypothetical protein
MVVKFQGALRARTADPSTLFKPVPLQAKLKGSGVMVCLYDPPDLS